MAVFYPVSLVTALWLLFANFLLVSLNENSWLAKKSGFHGFLTVSNRAKGITRDKRPQEFFAWDLLDPATLVREFHHVGFGASESIELTFCFAAKFDVTMGCMDRA